MIATYLFCTTVAILVIYPSCRWPLLAKPSFALVWPSLIYPQLSRRSGARWSDIRTDGFKEETDGCELLRDAGRFVFSISIRPRVKWGANSVDEFVGWRLRLTAVALSISVTDFWSREKLKYIKPYIPNVYRLVVKL